MSLGGSRIERAGTRVGGPKADPAPGSVADERRRLLEQLWAVYRAGPSDQARNDLVEAYQQLVLEVARRFAQRLPRSVDRGDLMTAASVGLMGAIAGFDPTRGVRFESYCELRVKGALLDELRNQDWLPRPWRARLEQQKRVIERLRAQHSRDPADEEVAAAMEMAFDEYLQVFGTGMPGAPTGSAQTDEGPGQGILDVVADPTSGPQEEELTREEILGLVAQRLSEQEYRVLYLKYWEGLSMREIGLLTKLSESRVSKLHARLIERLRDRFHVARDL